MLKIIALICGLLAIIFITLFIICIKAHKFLLKFFFLSCGALMLITSITYVLVPSLPTVNHNVSANNKIITYDHQKINNNINNGIANVLNHNHKYKINKKYNDDLDIRIGYKVTYQNDKQYYKHPISNIPLTWLRCGYSKTNKYYNW